MQSLNLDRSSRAILTKTVYIPDPFDASKEVPQSYPCDIRGERLPQGAPGLLVYRDTFTGLSFVRVAEVLPTGQSSSDRALLAELTALNPVHYVAPAGDPRGWFIVAPDFNERDDQAALTPHAPVQLNPVPVPIAPVVPVDLKPIVEPVAGAVVAAN